MGNKVNIFYLVYLLITLLSPNFPLNIHAQDRTQLDSLRNLLTESEGVDKLDLLLKLSSSYDDFSLDTALIMSNEGLKLARELNLKKYEADFLKNAAQSYYFKSDLKSALKNLFDALPLYESINDTLEQLNTLYGISICYSTRMQEELAKDYVETGLKLAQGSKYKDKEAIFSEEWADLLIELEGDFEKAIEYYNKSYDHFKSSGNDWSLSVTSINIGRIYTRLGEYSKAQKYLDESYALADKLENKNRMLGALLALGENYFAAEKYNEAKLALEKCYNESKNSYEKWALLSLKTLAKVDSAQGRYLQAFNTFNQYHNFYDSLTHANSQEKLGELEAKYQNEQKQAKIELLEKDNEIQTLWRNSFIGAFIFAFILAGGLYNRYRYKNKTSKKLANLNNQLEGELNQAAEYIESLLPPKIDDKVETDWKFIPSAHLGGDSFGYGFLDEDHFAFYLIDVSGHGVGAALLSTSVLNILKSKSLPHTDFYNPAEVLNNLNKSFNMEEHDDKYFALWYGVLNLKTYELVCASAFHPPAIGVVNGHNFKYGKKEMMIGAFENYNYENAHYQLSKGESIFLFSDGCFEVEADKTNLEFDDFVQILHSAAHEKLDPLEKIHSTLLSINKSDKFDDDFSILKLSL